MMQECLNWEQKKLDWRHSDDRFRGLILQWCRIQTLPPLRTMNPNWFHKRRFCCPLLQLRCNYQLLTKRLNKLISCEVSRFNHNIHMICLESSILRALYPHLLRPWTAQNYQNQKTTLLIYAPSMYNFKANRLLLHHISNFKACRHMRR